MHRLNIKEIKAIAIKDLGIQKDTVSKKNINDILNN
jgi:hypothetical protein